jgi:hypothetical protein
MWTAISEAECNAIVGIIHAVTSGIGTITGRKSRARQMGRTASGLLGSAGRTRSGCAIELGRNRVRSDLPWSIQPIAWADRLDLIGMR